MANGTIKTLRPEKGFGFITPDGGTGKNDLFFHHTAVTAGHFDDLRPGESVTFDVGPDPRDPTRQRATNVRPAGGAGPA
jgi:CspA family cold shock protein